MAMSGTGLTVERYARIAAWFVAYTDGFRGAGGALPGPLRFKLVHSGRVAGNAAKIAAGLGLDAGETALARAAGLLHDVGRFIQYAGHASFMDARSIDHGLAGRRVLEEGVRALFPDAAAFARLLRAVELHNRKVGGLPADLPPGENSLLLLLRDADKLDIMETMLRCLETGDEAGLAEMVPDLGLSRALSPGVAEAAARGETLILKDLRTLGDGLVMISAWFHDFNYSQARRLAAEKGFLRRFRGQLPASPVLDGFFAGLEKAAALPGRAYLL